MEQVSHHPPITAFFIKTDQFEISGVIDVNVDVGLNSAHTKLPNPIRVKIFKNNTEYIIKLPELDLSGIMFGDRMINLAGTGYAL